MALLAMASGGAESVAPGGFCLPPLTCCRDVGSRRSRDSADVVEHRSGSEAVGAAIRQPNLLWMSAHADYLGSARSTSLLFQPRTPHRAGTGGGDCRHTPQPHRRVERRQPGLGCRSRWPRAGHPPRPSRAEPSAESGGLRAAFAADVSGATHRRRDSYILPLSGRTRGRPNAGMPWMLPTAGSPYGVSTVRNAVA